ncbi:hypothetical protein GCM10009549_55720 [Streptomyces thermoalcalitolerans]|uniref:Uncharacterized protein n=1 Tax=Streptomyces thermoalcalitolerans TaxID=65605 RepID=A0ABN1PRX3_9ACTN
MPAGLEARAAPAAPAAPPYGASVQPGGPGAPAVDEGATQYLPPVSGAPAADEGATQVLPPVSPVAANEGATQYLPPVAPGALPPETGGDPARFPGPAPQGGAPGHNPDAEATQFMPPVGARAGGGRQTPAEFDDLNLFRNGSGDTAPATQQLPRIQQPAPAPSAGRGDGGGRGGRRTGSRIPLIAAAGVGIIALGMGAGALLSSGDKGDSDDTKANVSATAPATEGPSPSPTADPVREQAVALDRLLADSGNSRSAVIKAVEDVKKCENLDQAAASLRDAAEQRKDLVTRLEQLSVDKLPRNAELTEALTKAWKASEAADRHYAAWADQTAGKKGCKKGGARITNQTRAGNRESGVASVQKAKAAQLWNPIAQTYGLTQRQPTEL